MTRNEVAQFLLAHDNYCILTHEGPDGDTLGSAGGLCLGLQSLGKTAWVLHNPETGEHLSYLCEGLTVDKPQEGAILVSVDVPAAHMLPEEYREQITLRIDHHGNSTSFATHELVDPGSAACAEIIYDLLMAMAVEFTPEMALRIYTGTATDTGCFRFANTNAHTFTVAAACAATGANLQPINQALFDTVSLNKLRVQAWVTEHTQFLCGGKGAICPLPVTLAQELGVEEEEVGGLSGFVRSIEGVCLAATLRESDDGRVFISARAVPGYDAAALCARFGGGGHKGAAGAGVRTSLQELTQALREAMLEILEGGN